MEVSPTRLRISGLILRRLADKLGRVPEAGPVTAGWAAERALAEVTGAWDAHLAALAARVADSGERLIAAAGEYTEADQRSGGRLGAGPTVIGPTTASPTTAGPTVAGSTVGAPVVGGPNPAFPPSVGPHGSDRSAPAGG